MKDQKVIIALVAAVILAGAGGFFGGMQYEKTKVPARGAFGQNGQPTNGSARVQGAGQQRMGAGAAAGLRPVTGSIISADAKSITVKLQDGSSKIILFSSTTAINKAASATATDLKAGDNVRVFGTANTDGSIAAQNIQLNPDMPTTQPGQPAPAQQGLPQK